LKPNASRHRHTSVVLSGRELAGLALFASVLAVVGCSGNSGHPSHGPVAMPTGLPAVAATKCEASIHANRLTNRLAYGNDVFLPAGQVQPRRSAGEARRALLLDPSASYLGHGHRQYEFFARYTDFSGSRPVWVLLEHDVPSSGSLSNKLIPADVLDILDDRTGRPIAILNDSQPSCA
jgi:hypothetical protein